MKRIVFAIVLSTCAYAQRGVVIDGDFGSGLAGVRTGMRIEPASSGPWVRHFTAGWQAAASNSIYIYQRYLYDDQHHEFLGYDLMLEPQAQNTFRASFYELGMSPAELPLLNGKPRAEIAEWKKLPVANYPAPRMIHPGDTISVELWTAPDSGQRVIDDVRIDVTLSNVFKPPPSGPPAQFLAQIPQLQAQLAQMSRRGALAVNASDVPTVSGPAREFSASDAELQLLQPAVILNGMPQDTGGSSMFDSAKGSLVWFHLPGRGRYIFSLAPRPELGFTKAGEARGGEITFALGGDNFKLESSVAFAPGDAAYNLYVLHDPDWEPTAQAQRGRFQVGSVSAGEIELLRRK